MPLYNRGRRYAQGDALRPRTPRVDGKPAVAAAACATIVLQNLDDIRGGQSGARRRGLAAVAAGARRAPDWTRSVRRSCDATRSAWRRPFEGPDENSDASKQSGLRRRLRRGAGREPACRKRADGRRSLRRLAALATAELCTSGGRRVAVQTVDQKVAGR